MAKVATLTDAFTTLDTTTKWSNSYGTPTLTSGQVHLSCVSSYEGLYSGSTYDFTDSYIYAEFASIPTGGGNSRNTMLRLESSATNGIEVGYIGDQLYFREEASNVTTTWESVAYNSTNHRWWKLAHTTGTGFTFEVSPDGQVWTQIGAAHTSSITITAMFATIFCGYYGTESSPPDAVIDNVNTPATTKPAAGAVSATSVANGVSARTLSVITNTGVVAANQPKGGVKPFNGKPGPLIGMYGGYGNLGGIAGSQAGETLLKGHRMDVGQDYLPHSAWSDFNSTTMRTYQLDPWRAWRDERPGSKFVYGIPLLTDSNSGDFSGVAAGTYDSYFTIAGNALIAAGHSDAIVMLGWEPNNSGIGPWQATDNPSGYISAFQHVVTLMKALSGANFTFLLESSIGFQAGHTLDAFDDYYPGNTYVDYLGMNVYDIKPGDPSATAAARWSWILTQTGGLNDFVAYANSKSKPKICAEWGLYAANGSPDLDGGGDNPSFIQNMATFFRDNSYYYQSYFNYNWGGGVLSDYSTGQAAYVAEFLSYPQPYVTAYNVMLGKQGPAGAVSASALANPATIYKGGTGNSPVNTATVTVNGVAAGGTRPTPSGHASVTSVANSPGAVGIQAKPIRIGF